MFTSIDKAIVALIGSIGFITNYFFGIDWYGEAVANAVAVVVPVLTPLLTYLIPNKPAIE